MKDKWWPFTSYKFFLWFMRLATIPVIAGCYWMVTDSYHKLLTPNPNPDPMLALLVGLFGGVFTLGYFLVAWTCGWRKDR